MTRSVQAFLPVSGGINPLLAAFGQDPGRWLPHARRDGAQRWTVPLHAGAISRTVIVAVGLPWRAGSTTWRTIAWDPEPEEHDALHVDRFLPSFDGEIGLAVASGTGSTSGSATLIIDGRYAPPGGMLGQALDAVALHRVAQGTVERFLAEVASQLTAESLLVTR
ncbi:MAG: hypothetical protein WD011_08215 [Nitriliruptoraceae bacterium]